MKNPDKFYMDLVEVIAQQSYCERSKVGALLEKNGNIIAFGYNGTPAGFPNVCEIDAPDSMLGKMLDAIDARNKEYNQPLTNRTKPEVLHAESNAIAKCARSAVSSEDATLYCLYSPCLECAKLIIQAGIRRVVYKNYYRMQDGLELLEKAGLQITNLTYKEMVE